METTGSARFNFVCWVGKRLALFLTSVLYCLMVLPGKLKRKNTKYECTDGYELL